MAESIHSPRLHCHQQSSRIRCGHDADDAQVLQVLIPGLARQHGIKHMRDLLAELLRLVTFLSMAQARRPAILMSRINAITFTKLLTELFPMRIARVCSQFHVIIPSEISKRVSRTGTRAQAGILSGTDAQPNTFRVPTSQGEQRAWNGLGTTSTARSGRRSVRKSVTGSQHGSRAELFPSPDNTIERLTCHD